MRMRSQKLQTIYMTMMLQFRMLAEITITVASVARESQAWYFGLKHKFDIIKYKGKF